MNLEIECSLCKSIADSGEVFYQEEDNERSWRQVPEGFFCTACQEKRLSNLLEATPQQLLEWIRIGHPNDKGIPYGRFEVMDEIRRRPFEIFDGVHWPRDKEAKYKNRFTGGEETLNEMFEGDCHKDWFNDFEEWFKDDAWSILECWLPDEIWNEADVFEEYRMDTPNKLTGYPTQDTKEIVIQKKNNLTNWCG